jgi:hypothetical protein
MAGLHDPLRQDRPGMYLFTPAQALRRVLEFTHHSLDEVINDPIVANEVKWYFRLHRYIEEESRHHAEAHQEGV